MVVGITDTVNNDILMFGVVQYTIPVMQPKLPTILIVEDEKLIQEALKAKLTFEHFTVLTADNGQAGLEMALENHPDVILLDLQMPILDGFGVLQKLRADPWGALVPVIVLSNKDTSADIYESLKNSVQDYFIKAETSLETLVAAVRDILAN